MWITSSRGRRASTSSAPMPRCSRHGDPRSSSAPRERSAHPARIRHRFRYLRARRGPSHRAVTSGRPPQHASGAWLFRSARPAGRQAALRDVLAGFTLAAMNVPQSLGYTKIAGTPVVTGLYTLLLPLLAFAALGSSRYLVVASDSATAAILASRLAEMEPAIGSPRYVGLATALALLTALLLLAARLFRMGFLADFLSQTVLVGFLTGVGVQVGIAVLGPMLGLEVASRATLAQLGEIARGLPDVHRPTLALSAAVL